MPTWVDGVFVSLIAIAVSVLIGVLGYFMDKNSDRNGGQ